MVTSIYDITGNTQRHLCAKVECAPDCDPCVYSVRAFPHPLQTVVPDLSGINDGGVNAQAIVPDFQMKIIRISKFDVELAALGVGTCISDSFFTDARDFISNDGMQIFRVAKDCHRNRH